MPAVAPRCCFSRSGPAVQAKRAKPRHRPVLGLSGNLQSGKEPPVQVLCDGGFPPVLAERHAPLAALVPQAANRPRVEDRVTAPLDVNGHRHPVVGPANDKVLVAILPQRWAASAGCGGSGPGHCRPRRSASSGGGGTSSIIRRVPRWHEITIAPLMTLILSSVSISLVLPMLHGKRGAGWGSERPGSQRGRGQNQRGRGGGGSTSLSD